MVLSFFLSLQEEFSFDAVEVSATIEQNQAEFLGSEPDTAPNNK
jgi:hypothetical protein